MLSGIQNKQDFVRATTEDEKDFIDAINSAAPSTLSKIIRNYKYDILASTGKVINKDELADIIEAILNEPHLANSLDLAFVGVTRSYGIRTKLIELTDELNKKAASSASSSSSVQKSSQPSRPSVEIESIKSVNICEYPDESAIQTPQIGEEYSIGDLHSNPITFLQFLVRQGVARVKKSDFDRLIEIYNLIGKNGFSPEECKKYIAEFKGILANIKFNGAARVRLIGDETADRGKNDIFILLIEEALVDAGVPLENLVSNHGFEFIKAYETQNYRSVLNMGGARFAQSLAGLKNFIDSGIVTEDEMKRLTEKHKKSIKLIGYTLNEEENEITIYSHAGIDMSVLGYMADKYGVEFDNSTAVALAQSIDRINAFIKNYVENNELHKLCDDHTLYGVGFTGKLINAKEHPIEFILWNRNYYILKRESKVNGYKVNYVHGHDSSENSHDNIINLDNNLGKAESAYTGEYKILRSIGVQLAPKLESQKEALFSAQSEMEKAVAHSASFEVSASSQPSSAGSAFPETPVSTASEKEEAVDDFSVILEKFGYSEQQQIELFQAFENEKLARKEEERKRQIAEDEKIVALFMYEEQMERQRIREQQEREDERLARELDQEFSRFSQ